jgi:hypothetical protein
MSSYSGKRHNSIKHNRKAQEDFYIVDWFHGDLCTTGCEVHMNFTHESACLKADNVSDEVVTIHILQDVLKMLPLYTWVFFEINRFFKNHRYDNPSCIYSTPDTSFHWMEDFMG